MIPFVIAVIALFASRTMRAINAATPSAWLIGIQTYRVAGIMFIFPFLTYGIIPAGFAWPAGVGDALTGILAPVVASLVAGNRPHAREMGGGMEPFRHPRSDRCSGYSTLLSGPSSWDLPAVTCPSVSRSATRNSYPHPVA